ncbi:stage III sporulation protein AE [Alkalihalobacterium chitinilyticum]|uniref:Stage III sporulation protein AE n=1 Tax=Alkalihalobacterium chitinilyticum TaxID=2980103 RepID=A0ABT5V9W2_9BACI|nr:stage III sporulation protein AE [Alkalihalobacterium chitinilyticum]MDE5412253.1 stage III sporulation protein AE [Alkalihalobacterium chitinilyticum]
MRILTVCFFALLFFIPIQVSAETPSMDEHTFVEEQLDKLGVDEVREFWDKIATEYGGFLPESQKGTFMEFVKGEKEFSIKEWFGGLIKFFLHELLVNGKLLGSLILLTIFAMVLQSLQNAFEQHTISKVAYAITYMVLIVIALNSFHVAITYASDAINNMIHFMIALLPLLLALMAAVGSITSVALFHPLIVFLVNTSGLLIQHVVMPLLFLSALLSIVSTLSDHYKVTKLANFLRNISIGILGVFLTVFLGVISVQGATSAVADGITVRTAKFIAGNFVPVVGRMFTDAADTVMGASVLLKNTVGLAGLAILLMLCAFPAIKVLSLAIIYTVAAAVLQPLGGGPIIDCLSIIGKSVIFIFAALATVCLMFFLALTIIIAAGNVSLMMR